VAIESRFHIAASSGRRFETERQFGVKKGDKTGELARKGRMATPRVEAQGASGVVIESRFHIVGLSWLRS